MTHSPPRAKAQLAARVEEPGEPARLANALGFSSITKGMHYSSAPWQALQPVPFLSRIMVDAPDLRLNFGLILLMSVQWPGMPQSLVLEELHVLAEEVFPRVRRG